MILTKIPFVLIKNQIVIKTIVNNLETSNFIFDTGTENTHIDSTVAGRLKMEPFSIQGVNCTSGTRIFPITKGRLKVGELSMNLDTVIISSTKKYSQKLGLSITGLIGRDIFKNNIIKIDFKKNIIEVYKPNYIVNDNKYEIFELFRGPSIIAESVLQNKSKLKGKYVIDTGSSTEITLSINKIDSTLLNSLIGNYKTAYFRDICGNRKMNFKGKVNCFKIGNIVLDSLNVAVSITKKGILAEGSYLGLIGLPALKNFDIIIDQKNFKIYLKHN